MYLSTEYLATSGFARLSESFASSNSLALSVFVPALEPSGPGRNGFRSLLRVVDHPADAKSSLSLLTYAQLSWKKYCW